MLTGAAGEITEEQERQLKMVNNSSKRLLNLVNDLLDFSRVRAGKLEVNPERFTASEIAEHLKGIFCPLTHEKGLTCAFVGDFSDVALETDKGLVERVLTNLVGNAVKFTMEGSITLDVSETDGMVSFVVRDTGPGIPAGELPHLTKEFHRAGGSTSSLQGTGLGLAISDEIARTLGGRLEITSEVGVGSSFTLTIPAVYRPPTRERRT
jgi:signal transduction histidine kinase